MLDTPVDAKSICSFCYLGHCKKIRIRFRLNEQMLFAVHWSVKHKKDTKYSENIV